MQTLRTSLTTDCSSARLIMGHALTEAKAAKAPATESAVSGPFLMLGTVAKH